jgi:hypothetical protein
MQTPVEGMKEQVIMVDVVEVETLARLPQVMGTHAPQTKRSHPQTRAQTVLTKRLPHTASMTTIETHKAQDLPTP